MKILWVAVALGGVTGILGGVYLLRNRPDDDRPSFCWDCWSPWGGHHHHGERPPAASLKTITVAQVDFRSNDRDGNKVNDFWRGDIAGLYGLCTPDTTEMVKLLEISVAGADSHPLDAGSTPPRPGKMTGQTYYATRAPKAGYWFRAIRHADEKDAVDANSRFAACAYPDSRSAGRWTYVVDERNSIWRRDLGAQRGIDVFPTDEELRTLWSKLD